MKIVVCENRFIQLAEEFLRESELAWLRQMIAKEEEVGPKSRLRLVTENEEDIKMSHSVSMDLSYFP
jgi:hypothetical protein